MAISTGYTKPQIVLHWVTVALVLAQFLFHDGIADAFDKGLEAGAGAMTLTLPAAMHLGGGMIILGLTIYRLFLRTSDGTPPPPEGEPGWAALASKGAHLAFYGLLFLLPVTGAVAWAQRSEAAGNAHEVLRALLFFLILAHVGAVLMHQFVWKTGLIRRMMRPS